MEKVTVPNDAGGLVCYLARPIGLADKLGAVLIAHDSRGPTPHFEDVARRLALEGFVALLPDYASRMGGTPAEEGPARDEIGMLTWDEVVADSRAAIAWLKAREDGNGKVGMVGFGWGGSAAGRVATKVPDLDAAAVFYGRVPPLADVAGIRAKLLLNYAGQDQSIDADVPAFAAALGKIGASYEVFMYEGAQHAFDDDTSDTHYAPDAAKLAWSRMADFFKRVLVG
jgi:carboxymethylenebutenolidase